MELQENRTASLRFPTEPLSSSKIATSGETNLEQEVFGNDGFNFKDLLDVINPLQHIPGISTVYRDFTGDSISPASRIGGATLFFGPIGAAVSTANVIVEKATGNDIGGHFMAVFNDNQNNDPVLADTKPIGASEDITNATQRASWTNPNTAIQTSESRLLSDKEFRSLMAKGEPFAKETESLREKSIISLKAQGEPFDLGIDPEQLAEPETAISDTHVAFLISQGEPFIDEDNNAIDLSSAEAITPLHSLSIAQEASKEFAGLSQRTQKLVGVNAEVLEWASREKANRAQTVHAANLQPPKIWPGADLVGATAKEGGWFSDIMLTGLKSYQDANALSNSVVFSGAAK